MSGGIVIGIARRKDSPDYVTVNVEGTGSNAGKFSSMRVIEIDTRTGEVVEIGVDDELWWYQGNVVWTPAGIKNRPGGDQGKSWDIRLRQHTGKTNPVQQI